MHNKLMILVFETAVSWNEIPIQQVELKSRFPGQWLSINCSVNTSEKVTLWFKKNKTSEEELQVNDKTKISVSRNIFNIKRLTYMDRGYYICRVRELEKQIFLKILEGKHILKVKLIYYKKYKIRLFLCSTIST